MILIIIMTESSKAYTFTNGLDISGDTPGILLESYEKRASQNHENRHHTLKPRLHCCPGLTNLGSNPD